MLSPDSSVNSANTIYVQSELEQLIDLIIDNPHIPLTGRVLVNEEVLIEQIERIQDGLPEAFYQAEDVVRRQDEIVSNAERQAQTIIDQANRQAAQIANELGIRERAEQEALAIRQQVAQECDGMRSQTLAEIERLKRQLRQELDAMRKEAQMECEDIQRGADQYADRVLRSLESTLMDSSQKITSLTQVVRNGREQLQMGDQQPYSGSSTPTRAASDRRS